MKTTACMIGRKAVSLATMLLLSLGAGAALADGEPTDPGDLYPHEPLVCAEDPEEGLPGAEWVDDAAGELVAAAVRLLVVIAAP